MKKVKSTFRDLFLALVSLSSGNKYAFIVLKQCFKVPFIKVITLLRFSPASVRFYFTTPSYFTIANL